MRDDKGNITGREAWNDARDLAQLDPDSLRLFRALEVMRRRQLHQIDRELRGVA